MMRRFAASARNAWQGIRHAWRAERHMRFHGYAGAAALAAAGWLGLAPLEWALVLFAIALVIAVELINTAIERTVDLASPQRQEGARIAKDAAAGAVAVAALAAAAIGMLVFGPKLWLQLLHWLG